MLAARASTPAARQLTVERLQSCGGACHEPVIALMQARGPPILAKRAQRHDMTGADKPRHQHHVDVACPTHNMDTCMSLYCTQTDDLPI